MSGEIRGINPGLMGKSEASARPSKGSDGAAATQGSAKQVDSVELTGTAAKLQALEARLAELPEVDAKRVETLRAAIAEGRFNVDSTELAQKLTELESMLNDRS